jgi:hypothetical protein
MRQGDMYRMMVQGRGGDLPRSSRSSFLDEGCRGSGGGSHKEGCGVSVALRLEEVNKNRYMSHKRDMYPVS